MTTTGTPSPLGAELPVDIQTVDEVVRVQNLGAIRSHDLPSLNYKPESNGLERFWEALSDWIQQWLGSRSQIKIDPNFVTPLLWLGGTFVLFLVGYVAYVLYQKLRSAKSRHESALGTLDPFDAEGRVLADLESALQEKQFNRAARLRWRIFLLRANRPSQTTPQEFFLKRSEVDFAHRHNRLMFGETAQPRSEYDFCAQVLTKMEQTHGEDR